MPDSDAKGDDSGAVLDLASRLRSEHHQSLKLWQRMLSCTVRIENEIRARLRATFGITLPRFDMMAQLNREPRGLKMSELSRRLMVTGGNVTGLTDQLVAEGLVVRRATPGDRRAYNVRLTPKGKRQFDAMAQEHEQWITDLLSGMQRDERDALYESLDRLKSTLVTCLPSATDASA